MITEQILFKVMQIVFFDDQYYWIAVMEFQEQNFIDSVHSSNVIKQCTCRTDLRKMYQRCWMNETIFAQLIPSMYLRVLILQVDMVFWKPVSLKDGDSQVYRLCRRRRDIFGWWRWLCSGISQVRENLRRSSSSLSCWFGSLDQLCVYALVAEFNTLLWGLKMLSWRRSSPSSSCGYRWILVDSQKRLLDCYRG